MGFTSFGGSGGPGFSPNAFTTVYKSSAYTASVGERVISNGATITLPSATEGDVILVEAVGGNITVDTSGSFNVEGASSQTILDDRTVGFVAGDDGTNVDWFAVDGSGGLQ